jgi:non-homologous end joining protein Ku
MRAICFWKGSTSFALVNIPVKLYSNAVDCSNSLSPNELEDNNNRIKHKKSSPLEDREILFSELKKASQLSKDNCVVVGKQNLKGMKMRIQTK